GPPRSVVLTACLARPATLGVGSRPAATRVRSRTTVPLVAQVPASRHGATSSETVLVGRQSCGRRSHEHPPRFREQSGVRTSRMSTCRGCPPRGPDVAGGITGAPRAPGSSGRAEGSLGRAWACFPIRAHASAAGLGAHSRTNILFRQALFPDSLSDNQPCDLVSQCYIKRLV